MAEPSAETALAAMTGEQRTEAALVLVVTAATGTAAASIASRVRGGEVAE